MRGILAYLWYVVKALFRDGYLMSCSEWLTDWDIQWIDDSLLWDD